MVVVYDRIRPYAFSWADTFRRGTARMLRSRVAFPMHCPAPSSHHSVSIPLSTISICVYMNSVKSRESMISPRLLLVPMSLILSTSHHAFRRPIHYHTRPLQGSLHIDLALPWSSPVPMRSTTITVIRQLHAPTLSIFLCMVKLPLDARQKVKVSVDPGGGGKVAALEVRGGVSDA